MIDEKQKEVTEQYKENYDQIDWSKSSTKPREVIETSRGVILKFGEAKPDQVPVKGIPCIREDKPHESKNGAIHVDQVKSFNAKCARGTHYDPKTGNLISTSSNAREREARRRGLSFG